MKTTRLFLASAVCASMMFASCTKNSGDDQQKTSKGVLINGVVWALCNVDAPGTFAANPEDAGMYYQWNRKVGWSPTNPLTNTDGGTTWSTITAWGEEWTAANDPCPAGWRVPTREEHAALCDGEKTTNKWEAVNEWYGRRFTDKESGNSVFFPAMGLRNREDGTIYFRGFGGFYWSGTSSDIGARQLSFDGAGPYLLDSNRAQGYSVRCVAK